MELWRRFTAILGSSRLDRALADPREVLETFSLEALLFLECSSWQRWQASLVSGCPPQKGRLQGGPQLSIRYSTKQDHLRWRYSTVIHFEQSVYLAKMERFEKREKKRAEKKDLTIEKGRMVKRLLFLTPAFAPLALVLRAFGAQPMRF